MKSNYNIQNSLGQSHEYIRKIVSDGDTVIDCTAGNGHDTLFLAGLAGPGGKVYSFDIQKQAIDNTEKLLSENGYLDRVQLINCGHENLDKFVHEDVKAVMFNLGYLPGGDHLIGTKGETTETAVRKAMDLLEVHGLITIVLYYGGDSGFDEKEHILKFIHSIDPNYFTVLKTEFINQPNCPPIFICIEKLNSF